MTAISWGTFDDRFVKQLAEWIGDRRVLEVFAGNGLLASKLSAVGVDIVATSKFSGHDGHAEGMHFDVIEMDAVAAVRTLGADAHCLLMSWPIVSEAAAAASVLWRSERPIIFIGEVTELELGRLGGCASDLFFELTEQVGSFPAYSPRSGPDAAAIRMAKPNALEIWNEAQEMRSIPQFGKR